MAWRFFILILTIKAVNCNASSLSAAECGGAIPCQCGDTVVTDYTLTFDLGPCPRLPGAGVDTIGLSVNSGVTLDCQGHKILGPNDNLKNAFGIRIGARLAPTLARDATVRNCEIAYFWWGIYVQKAENILLENNTLRDNGWKDPKKNGTGYGLDVANSRDVTVRNNMIVNNGNEGFHLSHSTNTIIEDNLFADNGFEQLYLYFADDNTIHGNTASGGRQSLEMRFSNRNLFSYNRWINSQKQWLENDNTQNTFFYDHFHGLVQVARKSEGNLFTLCEFTNPTGVCLRLNATDGVVYKGRFSSCKFDVRAGAPAVLDRCAEVDKKAGKLTLIYPGCVADVDDDGDVDAQDRAALLLALGSQIGDVHWNPLLDIDHDGDVDNQDQTLLETQIGLCPT
jgi:parallel beta-helix repeat protein